MTRNDKHYEELSPQVWSKRAQMETTGENVNSHILSGAQLFNPKQDENVHTF